MKKIIIASMVSLMGLGLAGCDNQDQSTTANPASVATVNGDQRLTLSKGRFSFVVPKRFKDQAGQLQSQSTNSHVFSDASGRASVITFISPVEKSQLDTVAEAMVNSYQSRDSSTELLVNEQVMVAEHPVWQLTMTSQVKGVKTQITLLLAIVADDLITILISLPENDATKAEVVKEIMNSIQFN